MAADVPPRSSPYDLSFPALQALMDQWGEPPFRARQVWEWLYVHLADDWEQMTNLPRSLRERLAERYPLLSPPIQATRVSSDGLTRKDLLRLADGETVEAVLMRYERRRTACISTQVGCPLGCVFCATGQVGFRRNLSAGEIVAQALHFARVLGAEGGSSGRSLSHVVLMGMGEPLLNYEATVEAIRRLSDPQGFRLGQRRITLSTVGIVPEMDRLASESNPWGGPLQITLAVSLHAATDDLRNRLVPVNRRYGLDALFAACRRYFARTGRRLSFEWVLIAGVNDSPDQAEALVRRLEGLTAHVNLIPLNPTPAYDGHPSSREAITAFTAVLERRGVPFTVRLRRGTEIQAGCGQLRGSL
ncbi:MAG: 23S rRNA (adenine(2503)-C(2))-methyltransferase RlmN [Anaerolineae bacterium]|nr:23S rRNA (adenine(2503)-C(2))-methyltransferase RlmN [Anaerolineae bacterium]MDW8069746.1 23S rRNA (adenine(2503)-C(2))-methyltransferase RlmN [Anaerolineae bacterium]